MNLLSLIIDRLNQRVATHNLFDQIYGLSELNQNGNEKAWINYIGDGQAQVVSDYDGANGTLFWAKRGRVTLSKNDQYNAVSCKQLYLTSIPLTAYAIVRKSSLPCDLADSVDFVANQIFKYVSGKDVDFKIATGLIQYDVVPASYGEETKSLSKSYEWACVTVDFNIEITSDSNDGCYAPCDNVPLPPYNPPTGSCCNIAIYDEGQIITESVTQFDFTGEGVTATSVGGAVTITITGGGSGSAEWGSIGTGTGVSSQTDLVNYLLANFYPLLSNPSAFLVAADLLPYITSIDAALTYYPIPTGLTTDYIRGDGSIAAFPSAGIGTVTDFIFTDGNGFTGTVSTSTSTPTLSLTIQFASATQDGQLSSADWSTFNGKFDVPTGTNADYLDGTGTPTLFPTMPSGGIPHAIASGTDTYLATITGVASYADGDAYLIRFTNGNTTVASLNINSLGAIPLYRNNDGLIIGGDIWDGGEMICTYNSTTNGFQCIGISPNSLFSYVTNADSVTINKGQVVYAFGGVGDRMTVKLANNVGDATSAQTVGLVLSTSIAANQKGIIIMQGLLDGLSILPTSTYADGDPIYLGATAGSITNVKPYAPNHLVYLGTVTTASNGASGRMYVRVQNGYELDELHNVQAQSPTLKDTLWYDNTVSPAQWKTASISTILGSAGGDLTGSYPSPSIISSVALTGNPTTTTQPVATNDTTIATTAFVTTAIKTFSPYQRQTFWNRNTGGAFGNVYVASNNILYVVNNSNAVYCYNATTGALVTTLSILSPFGIVYFPLTGVLYVSNTSTAVMTRVSTAATPTILGTTTVTVAFANKGIEYSATKGFLTTASSVDIFNPSANTSIGTIAIAAAHAICLNSNVASAQNDRLVVTGSGGVTIINPTTNAITAAASNVGGALGAFSFGIIYIASQDLYVVCDSTNNRLCYLTPATATTFTASYFTYSLRGCWSLAYDSTNNVILVVGYNTTTGSGTIPGNVILWVIDATTRVCLRTIITNCNWVSAGYADNFISIRSPGIAIISAAGSTLSSEIIYA